MRIFRSENFKNSHLLYCMGSLFGKKKLNHRTNNEMSNYLCASEILIVAFRALSRKVVGKSARDNPERYCG